MNMSQGLEGRMISVIQGQFHVSDDPNDRLSTVLGSCIACCMFDPEARIGGMNHFLLAQQTKDSGVDVKFGSYAMEMLINSLLKGGAQKSQLRAKLFGGATITNALRGIGEKNAQFAKSFLIRENIPIQSESLGGTNARRIHFWPTLGNVKLLMVPRSDAPIEVVPTAPARPATDEIELF